MTWVVGRPAGVSPTEGLMWEMVVHCHSVAALGEKAPRPGGDGSAAFPPGTGCDVARLRAQHLAVRVAYYRCGGLRIIVTAAAVLLSDARSPQVSAP